MPFQTGTATDQLELFDRLRDFATSEGAVIGGLTATVAAGGSGYSIGDDITVLGDLTSDFKVAAVFNIDSEGAVSAAVAAGGTGYSVSDQLTLVGGTFGTAAVFNVDSIGGGGEVTGVSLVTAGDYTVTPGSPVSTTGGGGTGATLTVTFGAAALVSIVTHGNYFDTPANPALTSTTSGGSGATLTVTYSPDVAAGGTGYTLGDILTAVGGTSTSTATFEVTGVSAGVVTSVIIIENGGYTVEPGNPVSTTGGTGTGATLTLNFDPTGWTLRRNTQEAASAVIAAGGTGYVIGDDISPVGGVEVTETAVFNVDSEGAVSAAVAAGGTGYSVSDQLTLSGGTFGTAAVFNVDAVSGGVVTAVSLVTAGDYTVTPGDPVATTGGGGTGATLNMTFGAVAIVSVVTSGSYAEIPANPAATTGGTGTGATLTTTWQNVTGTKERDLILDGDGGGAENVIVGIRTFTSGGTINNWELAGMTGYAAGAPWATQPDISPGRNGSDDQGQYVPLDNQTITYWLFIDGFRIIGVFKIGTTYTNMYLGFVNRFGTITDYAYPLMVLGCSSAKSRLFSSSVIGFSGMVDPIAAAAGAQGPARIRDPGGTWKVVKNSEETTTRDAQKDLVIWPAGEPDLATEPDARNKGSTLIFQSIDFIPNFNNPGNPVSEIIQSDDSVEDKSVLWSTIIIESSPVIQLLGELAGAFWVSAKATPSDLTSEDLITVNGSTFFVFHNCNRTDVWARFAIERR